jgi:hypothetical protein
VVLSYRLLEAEKDPRNDPVKTPHVVDREFRPREGKHLAHITQLEVTEPG